MSRPFNWGNSLPVISKCGRIFLLKFSVLFFFLCARVPPHHVFFSLLSTLTFSIVDSPQQLAPHKISRRIAFLGEPPEQKMCSKRVGYHFFFSCTKREKGALLYLARRVYFYDINREEYRARALALRRFVASSRPWLSDWKYLFIKTRV